MNDLDDRLHALGELLEDGDPMPKATIERRAARLRQRRRLLQTAGAVAASLAVVAGSAAMLTRDDDTDDVTTDSPPPKEEPTTTTPETTLSPTTSAVAPSTTESQAPTEPVGGDLASATTAVHAACREFYGFTYDINTPDTSLLSEPELVSRCDEPQPEFRSDCYAERPATFVPGEGGCAVLHGYLAVYYGEPPDSSDYSNDPSHRFVVGDDVWWIYPESD